MKAKKLFDTLKAATLILVAAFALSSCETDVNDERIPYARVYIPFSTAGDWINYGVSAPLDSRRFVPQLHEPANYQWLMVSAAGYGGVLLTCDVFGGYWAFDAACPVERDPQVRVAVVRADNVAKCPKCGSIYDVFGLNSAGGVALSGPAAARKRPWALRSYTVLFGVDGRYALISN